MSAGQNVDVTCATTCKQCKFTFISGCCRSVSSVTGVSVTPSAMRKITEPITATVHLIFTFMSFGWHIWATTRGLRRSEKSGCCQGDFALSWAFQTGNDQTRTCQNDHCGSSKSDLYAGFLNCHLSEGKLVKFSQLQSTGSNKRSPSDVEEKGYESWFWSLSWGPNWI